MWKTFFMVRCTILWKSFREKKLEQIEIVLRLHIQNYKLMSYEPLLFSDDLSQEYPYSKTFTQHCTLKTPRENPLLLIGGQKQQPFQIPFKLNCILDTGLIFCFVSWSLQDHKPFLNCNP